MTAGRALLAGAVALVAAAALAAQAGDPAPPVADGARPPEARPPETRIAAGASVRASHRVDVIAPGEKVETVIGRLRAARPPPSGVQASGAASQTGAGGREREGDHGQPAEVERKPGGDDGEGRTRSTEGTRPSRPGGGDRPEGHSSPGHLRP